MPIYRNKCRERYTLGAHILFLVCFRVEGHEGNHWDAPLEVAWSTADPGGHAKPEPTRTGLVPMTDINPAPLPLDPEPWASQYGDRYDAPWSFGERIEFTFAPRGELGYETRQEMYP